MNETDAVGTVQPAGPSALRVVVAGGGIGGLCAALAMHEAGAQVRVVERAPSIEPVGAGISLWPNALRALDVLGVATEVRGSGTISGRSGIRRPNGRWLGHTTVGAAIQARYGEPLVLVHRARLAELLLERLPKDTVRLGVTAIGVQPGDLERPATLHTDTGDLEADVLVAADGIRSVLRPILFPDHPGPRYAGYTAWRMIVPAPTGGAGVTIEPAETWGPDGERFATLPLGDGRLYCYATANVPAGGRSAEPDGELGELRRRFGGWHEPIPAILARTTPDSVLRNDVEELPPLPAMHLGRVALLGDAAHAITPDLGQGGCLAIEDAVVLAAASRSTDASSVLSALARYSAARLPRTRMVAARSRRAGRLYQRPLLVRMLAARLMSAVPASVLARSMSPLLRWRPPSSP